MAQTSLQLGEQKLGEKGRRQVAAASDAGQKSSQPRGPSDLVNSLKGVCGETNVMQSDEVVSGWSKEEKFESSDIHGGFLETNGGRKTSWDVCSFYSVGRLRGGTPESANMEEDRAENSGLENQEGWIGEVRRPEGWKYWEE